MLSGKKKNIKHIFALRLYTIPILLLPSLSAGLEVALCCSLRAASESHCLTDQFFCI